MTTKCADSQRKPRAAIRCGRQVGPIQCLDKNKHAKTRTPSRTDKGNPSCLFRAPANAPLLGCLRASLSWLTDTLTRVGQSVDGGPLCRTINLGDSHLIFCSENSSTPGPHL